ncbi:putative cellulase [Rosa chinensis]|uniref:Endoglucanase n=1 Tax=Rosa chinensis TaxID=74649 RepID=A0A2P6RLW4_ROSCH|nr:putative cellulase [Rosa chinensis]
MVEGEEKAYHRESNTSWGWRLILLLYISLVAAAATLTLLRNFNLYFHSSQVTQLSARPGPVVQNYANALQLATQFFDAQKSGKLMKNRVAWRGDSGLQDGSEEGLDLSKGMYDAGDLLKFGFPMAFTATVLSWAILEYGDQMKEVKQLGHAHDSLKWITDYLINAHPSPNVLYIQVGDPELDHNCWQRPETMTERRPLVKINTSFPGTEVAAETAAAMASASLVFRKIDSSYSKSLLKHAEQLFNFADTYRGSYSASIPQVQGFYNSSGYADELLWAATWLYHATGDLDYLKYVTEQNGPAFANWGSPSWFSWDDKHAATQVHLVLNVLMSRISFFGAKELLMAENLDLQMYRKTAEVFLCGLIPDSPTAAPDRTDNGLIWVEEWNCLQHAMSSAFLAVLYSDYMVTSQTEMLYCDGKIYKPEDLRSFSISQADYALGKNPMKMSYLVGYGGNYPQQVHHRGSSIPVDADTGCRDGFKWLYSPDPNPNVAVGALVGGPFQNDSYMDIRNNSKQGEPSTYNSALIVALLSGLVSTSSVPKHL